MARVTPRYLKPYVEAARIHGGGFESQLWRSRTAQATRFDAIVSLVGEKTLASARVADLGCGRGDLAAHLAARGIAIREGVGIEAVPELLQAAQARAAEGWRFEAGDFVADASLAERLAPDVCIFSGSLNTLSARGARKAVAQAFAATRIGVAFNFLSDRCGRPPGEDLRPARRFDTLAMLRFAFTLSPRVVFRQDHLDGHDAAIWIARAASSA